MAKVIAATDRALVWSCIASGAVLPVGARRTYEGVVYELYNDIWDSNWSPIAYPAGWELQP